MYCLFSQTSIYLFISCDLHSYLYLYILLIYIIILCGHVDRV